MNTKKYLLFIVLLTTFMACKKFIVADVDFDVAVVSDVQNLGDTTIFNFSGVNPDYITVYTGDSSHEYRYKDRLFISGGVNIFQFSSYYRIITAPAEPNTTLRIMASTDFNGIYDTTNVKAANWVDITNRAIMSLGLDNTNSGLVDIANFTMLEKPFYLAYRFLGYNDPVLKQPYWAIRTFGINYLADNKVFPIAATANAGWKSVDFKNPSVKWQTPSSGIIILNPTVIDTTGGYSGPLLNDDNDDWAISRKLMLNDVIRDNGFVLKGMADGPVKKWIYKFKTRGTYTVTFIAKNANATEAKYLIKPVTVNIN
jgi:hypothetical protein